MGGSKESAVARGESVDYQEEEVQNRGLVVRTRAAPGNGVNPATGGDLEGGARVENSSGQHLSGLGGEVR